MREIWDWKWGWPAHMCTHIHKTLTPWLLEGGQVGQHSTQVYTHACTHTHTHVRAPLTPWLPGKHAHPTPDSGAAHACGFLPIQDFCFNFLPRLGCWDSLQNLGLSQITAIQQKSLFLSLLSIQYHFEYIQLHCDLWKQFFLVFPKNLWTSTKEGKTFLNRKLTIKAQNWLKD